MEWKWGWKTNPERGFGKGHQCVWDAVIGRRVEGWRDGKWVVNKTRSNSVRESTYAFSRTSIFGRLFTRIQYQMKEFRYGDR